MAAKKKSKGPKAGSKQLTTFDEAALSKLTAKIETELSKPKQKEHKHKEDRSSKRKRADNEPKDANPHPKKRHAHEPKQRSEKPKKAPRDKTAEMLEEIKALGGDEADLDLVAGIDSDADDGPGAKSANQAANADLDKTFKNELAKFAAGLGFEDVRDEDGATDDEVDEAAVNEPAGDEEWEDESEHDAEKEESDEEEEGPPPTERLYGRGKLVSMRQIIHGSLWTLLLTYTK